MKLSQRAKLRYQKNRQVILDGGINSIPPPFFRFKSEFTGIMQGRYYIITGATKSSKTKFASWLSLSNTVEYARAHQDQLRLKIFYYSMEEPPDDVYDKYMSYLLYTQTNRRIRKCPDELNSNTNIAIDAQILQMLDQPEIDERAKFFEDHVIFDQIRNPSEIYADLERYALNNGTVHTKIKTTVDELGNEVQVEDFDYYTQNDEKEYRIIFIDHIGLCEEGSLSKKQVIDKMSDLCMKLRNKYNYTIIAVQQQSMDQGSADSKQLRNFKPSIETMGDSRTVSRDCDCLISIFNPFRYGLTEYNGYDITKFGDHIRFIEIIAARRGRVGGCIAMYHDGAVDYFEELPKANDTVNLQAWYNYIDAIDNNYPQQTSQTFLNKTKIINKKTIEMKKHKRFHWFHKLFCK